MNGTPEVLEQADITDRDWMNSRVRRNTLPEMAQARELA
jgi:hypothetical protein